MNLKSFLDAANEAEARVQQIAAQIDGLFSEGKTAEALAAKPQLDAVKADAKAKGELYVAMLSVSTGGSDPAQRFMPNGGLQVVTDEADQPFKDDAEFFRAVKLAGQYPGRGEDIRLRSRKVQNATGLSESIPADGGYLLSPQTSGTIIERMYDTSGILGRISKDPVEGNAMDYNGIDETTHADGTMFGGVTAYWVAEGATITASQPKFYQLGLKLKDVAALCYATNDQLADTRNLASWLNRNVPVALRFKAEDAIVEGDGIGKPFGITLSPAVVKVLRADANKVQLADINAMWARRWLGTNDYVWLINQDVLPQLEGMTAATAPVYLPPGGMSAAPFGMLKGKPVLEVEYCQTMGTFGDILLASLPQYQAIDKAAGTDSAVSIHVAFVSNQSAFRFVYRVDGAPLWHSALTPLHGSNTVSPFVGLDSASA